MTFKMNPNAWGYFSLIAAGIAILLSVIIGRLDYFLLAFVSWLPFGFAVASVLIDLILPDHVAARTFNTYETMIRLQTRLGRNLLLIVYPQIVLLAYLLLEVGADRDEIELAPVIIMISAIFATVGWLYSNYMSSVNARAQATVTFLKEAQSNEVLRLNQLALRKFIRKASKGVEDDTGTFVFSAETVEELQTRRRSVSVNREDYQFRDVCSYLLAHHEYVGLAVRTGNFHFDIIQRQRKRVTISMFNTLINVILQDCGAQSKKWPSRYPVMPHSDRWENFVWLVMTMDGSRKISEHIQPSHKIDMRRYSAKRDPHHTVDLHPLDKEETA
jgi:hypothetical protein